MSESPKDHLQKRKIPFILAKPIGARPTFFDVCQDAPQVHIAALTLEYIQECLDYNRSGMSEEWVAISDTAMMKDLYIGCYELRAVKRYLKSKEFIIVKPAPEDDEALYKMGLDALIETANWVYGLGDE